MTICAISTAPGIGGIAVVRISGDKAFSICDQLFVPVKQGVSIASMPANSVHFGQIVHQDDVLDDVLVTKFVAPHSFTGEDVVEIACHGSQYIQQELLKLLIEQGCTMARPGEFTQRAFLNGKMDLSQAEAVADLIASRSQSAHRLALNQMRGGFSQELAQLRDKLLTFTSLIELELDFSDHEDVEFANRDQLHELADAIEQKIATLKNSFSLGNALKNGIPVAIVGATNAGKSTLLNALVGDERAIVSDIHGTTRDIIEDTTNIDGVLFRFIDTAGLRSTSDTIESMGIERSYGAITKSDIVLIMADFTQDIEQQKQLIEDIKAKAEQRQIILIFNKIDKINAEQKASIEASYNADKHLFISAKDHTNLDLLRQELLCAAKLPELSDNDVMVTNARHYEALMHAYDAILRVQEGLRANISGDFLSQDLRECISYLGEITGQITTDEVLGNIFSKFCIGK